ncbi:MAG: DUF1573 domain-containing protein [Bacteroidaceae bacterium]|nr:DUF1573 domain-containing protein [Bacteroidaceae bacterium]
MNKNLFRLSCVLLAVLSLASCKESEKDTALRLVREWDGKEVKFPARSVFTIQGKDTVDFDFKNAKSKVLVYVDSIGCTSCKLQLHMWKSLMEEVDSLTGGTVPFVFYFHPKDVKELNFLIRRDKFRSPVCFDTDDELNRLNHFPSDITFQTFLLDGGNRVKVIGNPVLNPNVKELYIRYLTGEERQTEQPLTEVSIPETEYDFGSFPQTETKEHVFRLVNTGVMPLVVHAATTSCGCTRVEYDKSPTPPGGTKEVRVTYQADEAGRFNKAITLHCNTENPPLILKVCGEVYN